MGEFRAAGGKKKIELGEKLGPGPHCPKWTTHKVSENGTAFHYYINRMITMHITKQVAKQVWNNIITIAQNNGFPVHLISQ
jgi:hypothetical protein